jgi:delta8-fatty-acid desaturase
MNFFYRSEILRHNRIDDCWIIVRYSVYDITGFIKSHPGGSAILLSRAGEDATSYFITKHSKNKSVLAHLEKLKIGELIENERITANDFDEPFLMELIDRCYSEKLYQVSPWHSNPLFWIRAINILIFFALSLFALYSNAPWYLSILAVLLQAMIGTSLFGLVAHEDTHRNYTKNIFSRMLLRITWPIFWPFISQNPLKYEHNSHHIKIGDPEYDYEVAAFAPIMRYSGSIRHSSLHKYQHKLAKYFYPFYANIITTIGGIKSGFWKRHNRNVTLEHSISVLGSSSYFIILPTIIHGSFWEYVALYLIYQCNLYYGVYVSAAINHFVPTSAAPIPAEYHNKYGYYICHNTTDFCTDSPFWFWYTGGFNIQIEHHLIPFIPVENLRKMTPIVRRLCDKYGYPYQNYNSFIQLWNDHYKYLFMLSGPETNEKIETEIANKKSYQAR